MRPCPAKFMISIYMKKKLKTKKKKKEIFYYKKDILRYYPQLEDHQNVTRTCGSNNV